MSEHVRLSFRKWDVDGTGIISQDELGFLLRSLDPQTTDEDISVLFSAAQIDHEDKIHYERFVTWLFSDQLDVFGKLGIAEFNTAVESKCLWEIALSAAVESAAKEWPKAKVDAYFSDVRGRVMAPEFAHHVEQAFSNRSNNGQNESVSFEEVVRFAESALQCTANMAAITMPPPNDIRIAFDAHDAKGDGRGRLATNELVDLMRYLQVRVALATLIETETRATEDLKLLNSNKILREKGLWEGAIASAKAKAFQRYDKTAVDSYFEEVKQRLCSAEYGTHVKGDFFTQVDTDKDGKVSFDEASGLISSTLVCCADLAGIQKPTKKSIRRVFDAHDTTVKGLNFLGEDEFLNLMRYLQVQVAEAMLPLSLVVKPG